MATTVTTITATVEDFFTQPVSRQTGLLARDTAGTDIIVAGAVHNMTSKPAAALVGSGRVHLTALHWHEEYGHRYTERVVITPAQGPALADRDDAVIGILTAD